MFDFFSNHLGEVANFITIALPILGAIFWSHRKLHADIQEVRTDVKNAHARIDATGARIDAMGARIDATGNRIDQTIQAFNTRTDNMYQLLMTHLTKDKAP